MLLIIQLKGVFFYVSFALNALHLSSSMLDKILKNNIPRKAKTCIIMNKTSVELPTGNMKHSFKKPPAVGRSI